MRCERCAEIVKERLETKSIRGRVVLSSNEFSSKPVQHEERFVSHSRTTNDTDRITSMFIRNCVKTLGNVANRVVPGCRDQLAALLVTDHRRANARFVVNERMCKPAFDAKEFAVDAVDVAITRDGAHHFAPA